MRETVKRYRLKNKEKLKQKAKLWRENNKDKVKQNYERRRSKDNFKEQSKKWRYSKNNKCVDCGKPISNRATRCKECYFKNKTLNATQKETIICKYCKQSFVSYKKFNRLYCSKDCYFKGREPYNKDKTLEEIYGKEKADKIRKTISEVRIEKGIAKGENNPMYGRKRSEKVKMAVSEANKGEKNYWYGRHHSEESKRKVSATKQEIPLEEWEKFISFEPYTSDFNIIFKETIRKRENYCCIVCNKPQEELGMKLSVHHIDYDKINTFPQNCVSLCRDCHLRTNINREEWKTFFQSLLKKRYNYQYTSEQKIILDFY